MVGNTDIVCYKHPCMKFWMWEKPLLVSTNSKCIKHKTTFLGYLLYRVQQQKSRLVFSRTRSNDRIYFILDTGYRHRRAYFMFLCFVDKTLAIPF